MTLMRIIPVFCNLNNDLGLPVSLFLVQINFICIILFISYHFIFGFKNRNIYMSFSSSRNVSKSRKVIFEIVLYNVFILYYATKNLFRLKN